MDFAAVAELQVLLEGDEESGDPPGGDSYVQAHPLSGQMRDLDAVSGD